MSIPTDLINSQNSTKTKIKIAKTTKVVCTQCSRKLGEMLETLPRLANNTEIKHIFVCPCGGESFTVKVNHSAFFLTEEGLITTSIVDIGINKFKSTVENHDGE